MMIGLALLLAATSYQCCTCGTCIAIQANDLGTAWAACVATGQNSAWRVIAMQDPVTGVGAAQRYDGCSQMQYQIGGAFDLCGDPCAKKLKADIVVSCWNGNQCQPWSGVLGNCPANWFPSTTPCAAVPTPTPTPQPTAAPTPTATPTPVPLAYTVQQFQTANAIGYTYIQALNMIDGTLWGNGGVCCPGVGDGIGECLFVVDFTQPVPVHREWWCTYRDSSELYETVGPQVAHSDRYRWVVAAMVNRRPAVGALQSEAVASLLVGFGTQSLTDPYITWKSGVGRLLYPENRGVWPLGILDLRGVRWIYAMVMDNFYGQFELWRFQWPDANSTALWDPSTKLAVLTEPLSDIAIDKDGSLVSTVDTTPSKLAGRARGTGPLRWWPTSDATQVKVVRSTDEGRTWAEVTRFNAPVGKFLCGCGWDHKSGGGAVQPWHLVCTISSGKGPDAVPSDWNFADIRVNGAKVPANWTVAPVLWK
jgi:hypothetical protein